MTLALPPAIAKRAPLALGAALALDLLVVGATYSFIRRNQSTGKHTLMTPLAMALFGGGAVGLYLLNRKRSPFAGMPDDKRAYLAMHQPTSDANFFLREAEYFWQKRSDLGGLVALHAWVLNQGAPSVWNAFATLYSRITGSSLSTAPASLGAAKAQLQKFGSAMEAKYPELRSSSAPIRSFS